MAQYPAGQTLKQNPLSSKIPAAHVTEDGLSEHDPSAFNTYDDAQVVHVFELEQKLQFEGQPSHLEVAVLAKKLIGHSLIQFPLSSNRPVEHKEVDLRIQAPWLLAT